MVALLAHDMHAQKVSKVCWGRMAGSLHLSFPFQSLRGGLGRESSRLSFLRLFKVEVALVLSLTIFFSPHYKLVGVYQKDFFFIIKKLIVNGNVMMFAHLYAIFYFKNHFFPLDKYRIL